MCCVTVNPEHYIVWAQEFIAESDKRYNAAFAEYKAIRAEYDAKSAWYRFWHTRPGESFNDWFFFSELKEKHGYYICSNEEKYLEAARYALENGTEFRIPHNSPFFQWWGK